MQSKPYGFRFRIYENFNSFLKHISDDEEPDVKNIRSFASGSYIHTDEIRFNSESEIIEYEKKIKEKLLKDGNLKYSNLNSVITSSIETIESGDFHQLFTALEHPEKPTNLDFFCFTKIISISDGYPMGFFAKSTALNLKKILDTANIKPDITAADRHEESDEIKDAYGEIKYLKLDNTICFQDQAISSEYDLVLMSAGLCNCTGFEKEESCAGIKLDNTETVVNFLDNIASILDSNKSHSRAFLQGANPIGVGNIDSAIEIFNKRSDFIASVVKNHIGEFFGVIIRPRL
ncbi:hypothetical protein [Endozoicomonas sp. ONNA2]|uniref:hypothetical protein n=1 Tax=Endozoicomonas sp. ONNA2 TaxID=2828741 RepID=UPI0021486594|nr:hypothetical protein [Endozoicomonas sp. ONNA2]